MNIQPLTLITLPGLFSVCKLDAGASIPAWAATGSFLSITRTADELSIVCPQRDLPDGVSREDGWVCLRVSGTLAFSMVGVLASLSVPLAEAKVSIFVISTFDTDYLLLKNQDQQRAVTALRAAGHTVD